MQELTGRNVLAVTVGFFAVIIGVNAILAYQAVSTFPGLEVENSYVASQEFDANKAAQVALGWKLEQVYQAGTLRLSFTDGAGLPVELAALDVLVGRTTEAADDSHPAFVYRAGSYDAAIDLDPGKWMLHVKARAEDGTLFQQRLDLFVKG